MEDSASILAAIDAAAAVLQPTIDRRDTRVAVVLGSGLGGVVEAAEDHERVSYADIPQFPQPGVEGHAGQAVFGSVGGCEVVLLSGRSHLYEGVTPHEVALPVRALARAGVRTVILTNAAGGLSERVDPGDIMLISDHINMMGANPLLGPNIDDLGPRFPGMGRAWDPELRALAIEAARAVDVTLKEGVYVGVLGPSFETAAEARAYALLGGDVAGMSTVPEAIAAVHAGMRVAGFSIVTNRAGSASDSHAHVLERANEAGRQLTRVLIELLGRL